MAAVAVMPPKKGPGCCQGPAPPARRWAVLATRHAIEHHGAEQDSMAPSMAMEKAAGSSRSMAASSTGAPSGPGSAQGHHQGRGDGGIPMPWVPSARYS